jgi:hypothetical protein
MESANLVLRTVNAVAGGTIQAMFTWNNIDLRTVLGDMYDRYDKFNLILDGMASQRTADNLGVTDNDLMLNITISGLPFINQTYDTSKNLNTSRAILAPIRFIRSSVFSFDYDGGYFITFGKSQEVCNITIQLTRLDNSGIGSASVFPHCVYYFHIVGIPNSDNKQLTPPERMDNNRGFLK